MDIYGINFDNCLKLNKTTLTMNFNNHVINETIVVIPANVFPFVRYEPEDYYDNSTQWFNVCGPIILLMRELARYRHSW